MLPGSNDILGFFTLQKNDTVLCSVCVFQGKTWKYCCFLQKGKFFYRRWILTWEKALERFKKHKNPKCHHESVIMSNIRNTSENVEDILHDGLVQERFENRQVLLKIIEGVRFLSRQGLPFRGNNHESNFEQLLLHSLK